MKDPVKPRMRKKHCFCLVLLGGTGGAPDDVREKMCHLSSRIRTSDILIIVHYYSQTLFVTMMSQLSYREGQKTSACAGTFR